ncbi:MAG: hypothetical protein CMD39_05240 [Gammaproteobacteria bacterium]|nr:hypothetical protein [Gammaproteobacteria bacterium]
MKGLQFLCLLAAGSLFAVTGLRQFFVEPLDDAVSNAVWFLLQAAPVLLVVPGMLRNSRRGYFYAILAASLYFIHGTMEAATADQRALALWETAFAVGLIAAASLAMRRLGADQ